jgi:N-glycosylase/DNA lyase
MTESVLTAPEFNLKLTLESGQVFHWVPDGNGFCGLIGTTPVRVEQQGESLLVRKGAEELVAHYFALDHPLDEIYETFPEDAAMQDALTFCRGIRIIRQPLWECLATFITSAMKQVKHIQQMSHALRERFGEPVELENGQTLFAYPTPERLAETSEKELRECGLGFRAKNLLGSAQMVAAGVIDLEAIRGMDDAEALAELCRLPGVGAKIANCALLFGYERVKAFPIDVWIERVLRQIYFQKKRNVTVKRLTEFSASYFGPYGGYAQQYLFHHARKQPRSHWAKPKTAKRKKP